MSVIACCGAMVIERKFVVVDDIGTVESTQCFHRIKN